MRGTDTRLYYVGEEDMMDSIQTRIPRNREPRILIVTPEITYLPEGMGNMANALSAKAGGLADVSASLVAALYEKNVQVHVALPHYRRMFHIEVGKLISGELRVYQSKLPDERIHLAEDRIFYYRDSVYSNYCPEEHKIALAFQREVINNIIPVVKPDLIHCNDWMTGLIPGVARRLGIPSLFTLHNIHTQELLLEEIEDRGIDAAEYWRHFYYTKTPGNYEATRSTTPVDLLASGIFGAHFINTVSPTFLNEIVDGRHEFVPPHIRNEVAQKKNAGCAYGILNAPDPSFNPSTDKLITENYDSFSLTAGKRANKLDFQKIMGLNVDPNAPLFFWPSRLDPSQKGCQLLADILFRMLDDYAAEGLQVAIVANGSFQQHFRDIVSIHDIHSRLAVCDFAEPLSHLGYAAADFMLMPSRFEPCGLPQMISAIYGNLPIVHNTGGLHDTVTHLNMAAGRGNGFTFDYYNSEGLRWAIDQAMSFFHLPPYQREEQLRRIMRESQANFTHEVTAENYFSLYSKMLDRPIYEGFENKENDVI